MKITDLKCTVLGNNPVIRISTDAGICGLGQAEIAKYYLKPHVLFYRDFILGEDPTDVERVMLKIRRVGAFKPWGSAVSAIEMALWDIAGKAAGLPVYKLLGGKVRDRVRIYNGAVRSPMNGASPQDFADAMTKMKAAKEGFSIIKQGIAFHSKMVTAVPDFFYGEIANEQGISFHSQRANAVSDSNPGDGVKESWGGSHRSYDLNRGLMTERGLKHVIACVEAMKDVLGDEVGLALDCGPGMVVPDAIRLAKALEPLNIMWLEDMITGDYMPYVQADLYREVTRSTSTPIHTGEQIYLTQNFKDLFEKQAINVVGPDPCDVGGIAELKRVAEYADLHGILIAPHGVGDGLIGLAALVHVSATLPKNYIAFEYPVGNPEWWYDIVDGLPEPIVKDGFIDVWDTPGLGVELNVEKSKPYLPEEDKDLFD
jgi:L-alanine-DL-glutamate epimerase-like enolase superfamily enzyme